MSAETIEAIRAGLAHHVPDDCWATGPKTGDPIEDLVICPGCRGMKALENVETLLRERDELRAELTKVKTERAVMRQACEVIACLDQLIVPDERRVRAAITTAKNALIHRTKESEIWPDPLREAATAALLYFESRADKWNDLTGMESQIASSLRAALERTK